jgi:hypothetical protein
MDHDVPLARRLTSHVLPAMAGTQFGEPKRRPGVKLTTAIRAGKTDFAAFRAVDKYGENLQIRYAAENSLAL